MVSPGTILALIRGSNPTFSSKQSKLAYAVHAWYLAAGYKLVAVGEAEVGKADCSKESPEVQAEGWDQDQNSFSFAYAHYLGGQKGVRLRMVRQGAQLRVTASDPSGSQAPRMLEIPIDSFVDEAEGNAQGYKDMAGLAQLLTSGLAQPEEAASTSQPSQSRASPHAQSRTAPSRSQEPAPGNKPRFETGPSRSQQPQPLPFGASDVVPPGFRPPGMPAGGFPSLMEPPRRGGGMHMGFDDPAFGGQMPSRGGVRGGGGMGGARWDPIAPPGMQGFHPEDFQRGNQGQGSFNPDIHPDVMQPGPRGSSNFDMFS